MRNINPTEGTAHHSIAVFIAAFFANFGELRFGEVPRIPLGRSWVNMGSGLFGPFVEVTDRAQPPLARLPAAELRAEHRHQDAPIPLALQAN
jgi:hypothetical protein